jgi:uncharacterized protein YybS (DUF2232 family)
LYRARTFVCSLHLFQPGLAVITVQSQFKKYML